MFESIGVFFQQQVNFIYCTTALCLLFSFLLFLLCFLLLFLFLLFLFLVVVVVAVLVLVVVVLFFSCCSCCSCCSCLLFIVSYSCYCSYSCRCCCFQLWTGFHASSFLCSFSFQAFSHETALVSNHHPQHQQPSMKLTDLTAWTVQNRGVETDCFLSWIAS